MKPIWNRTVSSVRWIVLLLAIALIAFLGRRWRDRRQAHDAWIAATKADALKGFPGKMTGHSVEEVIQNFQQRGVPTSVEETIDP